MLTIGSMAVKAACSCAQCSGTAWKDVTSSFSTAPGRSNKATYDQ